MARTVDSTLVVLNWNVGRRIRQDILKEKRAAYGKAIVFSLGREMTMEFGRGFGRRNLLHMSRFAEVFSDPKIVYALSTQLGLDPVGCAKAMGLAPIPDGLTKPILSLKTKRNWSCE